MPLFGPPNVKKLEAKRDVEGLIKALGYKRDERVRRAAAEALGRIGDARAVEPLIAALRDTMSSSACKAAARALGQIGDPRAVEPLSALLMSRNLCEPAAEALGRIGDARAADRLRAALKDTNKDVRQHAADALKKLGDAPTDARADARAVEPLIAAALKDTNKDVRQHAAEALRKIGAPAVNSLIAALYDTNGDVRQHAAEALDTLGWRPDNSGKGAAYWVAKRQWDKCVEIGAPAAVKPLLLTILDPSSGEHDTAAHTLFKIDAARAIVALLAATRDADKDARRLAVEALGKIGDAHAVEPLIAALKDTSGDVRTAAVKALDKLDWKPDKSEKGAAYWVAKQKWDKCVEIGAPAVDLLIATLKDSHTDVCVAAAKALGQIGDTRAVDPLILALSDSGEFGLAAAITLSHFKDAQAIMALEERPEVRERIRTTCSVCGRTKAAIGEGIRKMRNTGAVVITHDLIAFCENCGVAYCSNHYTWDEMAGTHTCRKCGGDLQPDRGGY